MATSSSVCTYISSVYLFLFLSSKRKLPLFLQDGSCVCWFHFQLGLSFSPGDRPAYSLLTGPCSFRECVTKRSFLLFLNSFRLYSSSPSGALCPAPCKTQLISRFPLVVFFLFYGILRASLIKSFSPPAPPRPLCLFFLGSLVRTFSPFLLLSWCELRVNLTSPPQAAQFFSQPGKRREKSQCVSVIKPKRV